MAESVTDFSDWEAGRAFQKTHKDKISLSTWKRITARRDTNGLNELGVIKKFHKRLYVHPQRFNLWWDQRA